MSTEIVILITVVIAGFTVIVIFLNRRLKAPQTDVALMTWLKTTQGEMHQLQTELHRSLESSDKNVTDTLQKSYQSLNERLDQATKVISELKNETGKFSEIGRSMKDLQDFLASPKLRGNLGEQILNDLLGQVLPKSAFSIQYRFRSGEIVDAVIKTQSGLIPIDSKFPMENYAKMSKAETQKEQEDYKKMFVHDVRRHIKAINEKYINTQEKTVDFALMYVPSESLYYEITANTQELCDYAQKSRVLFVSPSTFYAFLRTILVSFEGQRIQQQAHGILNNLRSIQKEALIFSQKLETLGRHVTNAFNNMNAVSSDFERLQGKIDQTQTLGADLEEEGEKKSLSDGHTNL